MDAAKHFMSLKKRHQAIVCANDYMALSLCKELTYRVYSVPHDIAISGFDDVRDARANVPPLTTCYVSVPDMAKKAMETIDTLLNGKEAPACTFVPTKIIIRNSCGCESSTMKDLSLSRMYEVEFMEQLINHNAHNTFVSISLENMTSAEDIGDYLRLEDVPGITRDFLPVSWKPRQWCLSTGKEKSSRFCKTLPFDLQFKRFKSNCHLKF